MNLQTKIPAVEYAKSVLINSILVYINAAGNMIVLTINLPFDHIL